MGESAKKASRLQDGFLPVETRPDDEIKKLQE
jgi:hypothetical protein